jgi:hypothetical protein
LIKKFLSLHFSTDILWLQIPGKSLPWTSFKFVGLLLGLHRSYFKKNNKTYLKSVFYDKIFAHFLILMFAVLSWLYFLACVDKTHRRLRFKRTKLKKLPQLIWLAMNLLKKKISSEKGIVFIIQFQCKEKNNDKRLFSYIFWDINLKLQIDF